MTVVNHEEDEDQQELSIKIYAAVRMEGAGLK